VKRTLALTGVVSLLAFAGGCNSGACCRPCDPCAPRGIVVASTPPSAPAAPTPPTPPTVEVPAPPPAPTPSASTTAAPYNATCPVMLGNPVDPTITTVHGGKVVGFCSTMCREKFLKNPLKYEKFLP
jgi:hypothetical protein